MPASRRIAVVSPMLDKRHGTERCVAEQIERLARDYGYEVHLYSERVEDVSLGRGRIIWHRVPPAPGPGLVRYLWWFAANRLWRWWDARVRGARYDLLYSPGINCLDADVISVHIVFREFRRRIEQDLKFSRNPLATWPRLLHRRLYYWLVSALERFVYAEKRYALAAVSGKIVRDLAEHYGRNGDVPVIYHGLDLTPFSPTERARFRAGARRSLGLPAQAFAVLLIGNDWKKKGLSCLLEAVAQVRDPCLWVLVVGQDDRKPFLSRVESSGLEARVRFLPVRPDVEFYYAAADAYVGPSLEDAFALPPAEAMACGLPVIVSSQAGVSEIVTDGVDALVLKDPKNAAELRALIEQLVDDPDLCRRLGEQGAVTARSYTWDRNAAELHSILEEAIARKGVRP